jgi:putative hydrolase of the HAD superfamily
MEGARAAIDGLAALGLARAVVSNSDGRAEQHLRDCEVLDGLAFVVDSHLVGVEKPDPGIFRIALERLGVAPSRAIFVGDILSIDQAGARQAGLHFVLIDPYGDYAPPGVATIPGIAELPRWLAANFDIRAGGTAPAGPPPAPNREAR